MISLVSILCGGLITVSAFCGFILNASVLYALYKNGFLNPSHNSVYILAFCNILGNTIQTFITFVYLGPTSVIQDDYFEGGPTSTGAKLVSWTFLWFWYTDMFLQPVVSLNRLIMVIFPMYSHFFDRKKTTIYGVSSIVLGFFLAIFSDFILPCCTVYVYYGVYSYFYIDTGYNYVNFYVDLPVNGSSSFISILCYIIIFVYVRKNTIHTSGVTKEQLSSRKIKEIGYAVQFAFCSLFILMAWVTFRVFPVVVPPDQLAWFTVIAMCVILHWVANSMIFVCFNKEFKDKFFGRISHIPNISQNTPTANKSKNGYIAKGNISNKVFHI